LILLAWLKALTARQQKTVGARLAGDGDLRYAIAGKPCSYRFADQRTIAATQPNASSGRL
jgi:hypothetical protein